MSCLRCLCYFWQNVCDSRLTKLWSFGFIIRILLVSEFSMRVSSFLEALVTYILTSSLATRVKRFENIVSSSLTISILLLNEPGSSLKSLLEVSSIYFVQSLSTDVSLVRVTCGQAVRTIVTIINDDFLRSFCRTGKNMAILTSRLNPRLCEITVGM